MATNPSVRLIFVFLDEPDRVITHGPCENEIINRIGFVLEDWTPIEVASILLARWEYWQWTNEQKTKGEWSNPSPLQGVELRMIKRRYKDWNKVVEQVKGVA